MKQESHKEHGLFAIDNRTIKPASRLAASARSTALFAAASKRPEKLGEIAGQMLGRPVFVTIVGSHMSYPLECQAGGALFADGRVVINRPFKWIDSSFDRSAPTHQSMTLSHVLLPDGRELHEGWQEIGCEEITASDYLDLQRRVEAFELAVAKDEKLPTTDESLAWFKRCLYRSPWTIDTDSGNVIDKPALEDDDGLAPPVRAIMRL